MTDVLIHDSGRSGKVSWAVQVVQSGDAVGLVISPWETPAVAAPRRPSAVEVAEQVREADGTVLFDPESHGVFLHGADNRRIYDQWNLWPRGPVKDLETLTQHTGLVAGIQRSLEVPFLAPTICLETPVGQDANLAIGVFAHMRDLAEDDGWMASIVGTPTFWSAGQELDAFVGRVAAMRPIGAMLSVLRSGGQYPWVDLTPDEVAGLCRTTQSLSRRIPVTIARADFAGLPAVAAGASTIGSGWDLKQRVLSADLYRSSPDIRRQSQRVSHMGLLASLKRREAEQLRAGERDLSDRLVPGQLPIDFNGHWRHHLAVIAQLARAAGHEESTRDRVNWLQLAYTDAGDGFTEVARHVRPLEGTAAQWISPLADGLRVFSEAEGL